MARADGNIDQAIQDYTNMLEVNPNDAQIWWMRGNAYWENGDLQRAYQDYNQALQVDPNYALAYLGRGNVSVRQGAYDQAVQDYNAAIDIEPNFIGTYNNRAVAYREQGKPDQALDDLNLAIALKPDFAEAYYNRGLAYHDKGIDDQALQDFHHAVELNPAFGKAVSEQSTKAVNGPRGSAPASQAARGIGLTSTAAKATGNRSIKRHKGAAKGSAVQNSNGTQPLNTPKATITATLHKPVALFLCLMGAAVATILVVVFRSRQART